MEIMSTIEAQTGVAVVVRADRPLSLDALILGWLDAKFQRTQSMRTHDEYLAVIRDIRQELQRIALDLDTTPIEELSLLLQAFASRPRQRDGQPVSAATHNRRVAIVSSFFTYARKHGLRVENPAELVERRPVQAYGAAEPMPFAEVSARLSAIGRNTKSDKRDYALLSLAFTTGRRLSELAALNLGDITRHLSAPEGGSSSMTIMWRHTKGGKQMRDEIVPDVARAILDYVASVYDVPNCWLDPELPLWIRLSRNSFGTERLSIEALEQIAARRLGSAKMHVTRHTFAVAMEAAGAKLTDISARLGHSNAATTGIYLERLHSAENVHAASVAKLLGITPAAPAPVRRSRKTPKTQAPG